MTIDWYKHNRRLLLSTCFNHTNLFTTLDTPPVPKWDIGRKSEFSTPHLHSTSPLREFPSDYCHKVWYRKTRMVWLPEVKKVWEYVYSFQYNKRTWQTPDRQTDTARRHAYAALAAWLGAVKGKCIYIALIFVVRKALRHGSHSFTCNYTNAYLYVVSVHQMAPLQT